MLEFILLLSTVCSTLYFINYRIVMAIKLIVYREWETELPALTGGDDELYKHSAVIINGFYDQITRLEKICFADSVVMAISWTLLLYIKLF